MRSARLPSTISSAALLLVALLALLPAGPADGASPTRPARVTGGFLDPHDSVYPQPSHLALIVQRADRVRARFGGIAVRGQLNRHASNTFRRGKTWDFGRRKQQRTPRMRRFIRSVMAEYDREGRVRLRVRAGNEGGVRRWRCRLTERTKESRCHRLR